MNVLYLYEYFIGKGSEFTHHYDNSEALYAQAITYWGNLENASIIFLIESVLIGVLLAICYYQPFNNIPGRHYKLRYWSIFGLITFILTFVISWMSMHFLVMPHLEGTGIVELKLSLLNSVYAFIIYFIVSWLWCQFNIPTNACRFLKI